jgi:hypothetical protein
MTTGIFRGPHPLYTKKFTEKREIEAELFRLTKDEKYLAKEDDG